MSSESSEEQPLLVYKTVPLHGNTNEDDITKPLLKSYQVDEINKDLQLQEPQQLGQIIEKEKEDEYDKFGGKWTKIVLLTIMLLTNVLGPLSTEAQVPALETIANDLNTSSKYVQLTITIYMLSFGASQLLFGTLSDIYGRRRILIIGLVIYVATNVGCALAPNIILLNIFRFIQAMGSGAGMVIVYAIARDVFKDPEQRTRVLAILGGLRPIVIASSPVYGGAVASFLGWRYIFWIIGILSFILLILVIILLPETKPDNCTIVTFQDYKILIKKLIKKRVFVGLVMISGGVYAGVFIMFNEFSFVMQDRYGISEFDTGLLCGGVVFGLMLGSLISFIFVKIMNPIKVVGSGIIQLFICGGLLILPLILYCNSYPSFNGLNIWWTLLPLFVYVMADGIMLPHLISTALEPFKKEAGTASAIAGFWRFFSAAVIALIVSSSFDFHLMVLHIGTACMAFISVIIYIFTLYGADTSEFTPIYSTNHNNNTSSSSNVYTSQQDQVEHHLNQGVHVALDDEDDEQQETDEDNEYQNSINHSIHHHEQFNMNMSMSQSHNEATPLIKKPSSMIVA